MFRIVGFNVAYVSLKIPRGKSWIYGSRSVVLIILLVFVAVLITMLHPSIPEL